MTTVAPSLQTAVDLALSAVQSAAVADRNATHAADCEATSRMLTVGQACLAYLERLRESMTADTYTAQRTFAIGSTLPRILSEAYLRPMTSRHVYDALKLAALVELHPDAQSVPKSLAIELLPLATVRAADNVSEWKDTSSSGECADACAAIRAGSVRTVKGMREWRDSRKGKAPKAPRAPKAPADAPEAPPAPSNAPEASPVPPNGLAGEALAEWVTKNLASLIAALRMLSADDLERLNDATTAAFCNAAKQVAVRPELVKDAA